MAAITSMILLLAGAVVGAVLAYAASRSKVQAAEATARKGAEALVAELNEQLRRECERRSAAEARAERSDVLEQAVTERNAEILQLQTQLATADANLQAERERLDEQRQLIERMEAHLNDSFSALSAKALRSNNEQFLTLARSVLEKEQQQATGELEKRQTAITQLVKPLQETLRNVEHQFERIEKDRLGSYERLLQQVQSLETKTSTLNTALRSPKARGRWGELQLRRVVELAGMVNHCDFSEQAASTGDEGRLQPDLVVRMPGGKSIVVDAKTPMDSYLLALEAPDDDERARRLAEHAARVRSHIKELGGKRYWTQFESTPELVVLFLPGEDLFSAALEQDPTLLEYASANRVALSTPTSLITTLRAVAHGWTEQALAENARQISTLGRSLYDRIANVAEMWAKLGRSLDGAVKDYNKSVRSMETRLLPTARQLSALEVQSSKEVVAPTSIETFSHSFAAPELVALDDIEDAEVIEAPALAIVAGASDDS